MLSNRDFDNIAQQLLRLSNAWPNDDRLISVASAEYPGMYSTYTRQNINTIRREAHARRNCVRPWWAIMEETNAVWRTVRVK